MSALSVVGGALQGGEQDSDQSGGGVRNPVWTPPSHCFSEGGGGAVGFLIIFADGHICSYHLFPQWSRWRLKWQCHETFRHFFNIDPTHHGPLINRLNRFC